LKKKIFSLLLVLALVATLIPFGAFRAKAASEMTASPELVEMIKGWEGFSFKPYWDYGQWTVGYGTRAPDEHLERYRTEGISQEEATELLNNFMLSMGRSVNSFIDKFGLTVTQAQFDAMLSFTYNCGSRWMLETGTLRTAIIEGWGAEDFLYVFGQWNKAGGVTLPGLVRRRLSEANLYLNGIYDLTPPDSYRYTCFDANGGVLDSSTQAFIAGEPVAIRPVATYDGCVFQGWYTDPTGGEKIEKLDASLNGYTLYAHWSAGDGAGNPQETPAQPITGTPVNYTRQIAALSLNAFDQPVKGALVVDAFAQYDLVDIVAEYTDSSTVKWGKVKGVGWINLSYTQEPGEENVEGGVKVKVTGTDVNIRRGPGTTYAVVGTANVGEELVILQTGTGSGYTWGRFNRGWIALKYTNYDDAVNESIKDENNNTNNDTATPPANNDAPNNNNTTGGENIGSTENQTNQNSAMGTVTADYLYIRSGAGVANPAVGGLSRNTRVVILEKKAVGGTIWGRIDKGWISLKYVVLDSDANIGTEQIPETNTPGNAPASVTGKVKLTSGGLNVRSGPSTGYSVVGSYANGAAVTILEQKIVGTMTWGRTDKGWISLTYVKLDQQTQEQPPVQTPEQPPVQTPEQTPTQTPEQQPVQTTSSVGTVSLTSGALRIRSGAGTNNAIVGNLYNGAKVTVTERKTVNGSQWGKIDKGWICLDYVKFDSNNTAGNTGTTTENTNTNTGTAAEATTGTVKLTSGALRIRSGAGTSYSVVGYLYNGSKVTVTDRKTVDGTAWGRVDKGWISLDYVVTGDQSASESTAQTQGTLATVTGTGLRIRSGAGTNNRIVGSLTIGDKVTILETTTVGGTQWGRIEKGWICMDYVKTN